MPRVSGAGLGPLIEGPEDRVGQSLAVGRRFRGPGVYPGRPQSLEGGGTRYKHQQTPTHPAHTSKHANGRSQKHTKRQILDSRPAIKLVRRNSAGAVVNLGPTEGSGPWTRRKCSVRKGTWRHQYFGEAGRAQTCSGEKSPH